MKLGELAFACYVFKSMTKDDLDYRTLLSATAGSVDLGRDDHCQHLLTFLTSWGCQQFLNPKHHATAKSEMSAWYAAFGSTLPAPSTDVLSLTEADFGGIEIAYDALSQKIACTRRGKVKDFNVTFGPTGCAKTLFVLRPKSIVAWDDPIRKHFGYDGSGCSYSRFLRTVQGWLKELSADCGKHSCVLSDLPRKFNEPHSTPAKMVDEYLWITVSQNCPAPTKSELERWLEWS